MYAKTSVAVLLGIAAATSAQTTAPKPAGAKPTGPIVSMLVPGADHLPRGEKMPLVGSIVDVKASMTTMAVACAPGTDQNICGMPDDGMTVTQGPSTAIMSTMYPAFGDGDDDAEGIMVGYAWECSVGGTTTAECVYKVEATATGNADPSVISMFMNEVTASASTTQLNKKDMTDALYPVTITAGSEKLAKSEATAASEEASKASSASGDAKNTASPTGDAKDSASTSGDAAKATTTPGAAATVKVGGMGIVGALVALFML